MFHFSQSQVDCCPAIQCLIISNNNLLVNCMYLSIVSMLYLLWVFGDNIRISIGSLGHSSRCKQLIRFFHCRRNDHFDKKQQKNESVINYIHGYDLQFFLKYFKIKKIFKKYLEYLTPEMRQKKIKSFFL